MIFKRPMLAATLKDVKDLIFPNIVSPKLDGIRTLVKDGKAFSRTLKPIPNKYIKSKLSEIKEFVDGEIMSPGDFNDIQSAVMSFEGEPKFEYHVFDLVDIEKPYFERIIELFKINFPDFVKIVPTYNVQNTEEFFKYEREFVKLGYEGIMARSPNSPYKMGRSTLKEGYLVKFKRFFDSEASIIEVSPLYKNIAESTINALGLKEKSHKISDLQSIDMVGSFKVKDVKTGAEFNVSTGMCEAQRIEFFKNKDKLIGKEITYKYQELSKDGIPRFRVFKGVRAL